LLDEYHGKVKPSGTGRGQPSARPGTSGEVAEAIAGPLPWSSYVARYLDEMRGSAQVWRIRALAQRVAAGETVTLLCSSACTDPARCHRTLLARLIAPNADT
jgi:uncharacterized protein YeaO (DUF488 family)